MKNNILAKISIIFCFQDVFSEEGLSQLWSELVKDGEVSTASQSNKDKREDTRHSIGGTRRSQFNEFLQQWTWGQVNTLY